jgi:cyclohexyl-isocyanide hydratase
MIIGIPVYQGVDLLDVTGPFEIFNWLQKKVEVQLLAASIDDPIVSRDGFRFLALKRFSDAGKLDVLWVPGGDPAVLNKLMSREDGGVFMDFLRDSASVADWICSVCEGAMLLAEAGLLDGYAATTHWNFLPCLRKYHHINVVDGFPRYVLDRNRLTGGGISSGLDEALHLMRVLFGDDTARAVQRTLQYYPLPPFDSDLVEPEKCMFFP